VAVRGAAALATSLAEHRADALLFRRLATLRLDAPLAESLDDLRWHGADSRGPAAAPASDAWISARAAQLAQQRS
jgi:hypothetical protein